MKTALVIPVFNEGDKLKPVLEAALKFIPVQDIIIVDDGSTDNSLRGLEGFGGAIIRHLKNLGKGRALQTGFQSAIVRGYKYVITLDADGQHNPAKIPAFLAQAGQDDFDLIIGSRRAEFASMPLDRRLSNTLTSFIFSLLSGQKILDAQCGFRLYSLDFIKSLRLKTEYFDTENELLLIAIKRKKRIGWVEIPAIYKGEISHIHHFGDTLRFIILVIKYISGRIR